MHSAKVAIRREVAMRERRSQEARTYRWTAVAAMWRVKRRSDGGAAGVSVSGGVGGSDGDGDSDGEGGVRDGDEASGGDDKGDVDGDGGGGSGDGQYACVTSCREAGTPVAEPR